MAVGTLIAVGVSVAISGALAAYTILKAKKGQGDDLGPQTLDGFSITQAKEGSAVPTIYGRARVPGNVIWYGNYETVPIEEEVEGGKGGGSQTQETGFEAYVDVWQSIGLGKLSLIKTYIDNKEEAVQASNTIFNDGTNGTFPTEPGTDANAINGASHIFYKRLFMGENATSLQTIHFVVERILPDTIDHANLPNGSNPAAIIYDILEMNGTLPSEIDIASFNAAALVWKNKGYGLNIVFDQQDHPADRIKKVMSFVDGAFYQDTQGRYALRAFDSSETVDETMTDDDISKITMRVPVETQLHNDFKGTFLDEAQDFSERAVARPNQALIFKVGERIPRSIDLKGFRDEPTASKRLVEVMETETYPAKEFDIVTNHLGFSILPPGSIIDLSANNNEFTITNLLVRVLTIDVDTEEANKTRLRAVEVTTNIFPDKFLSAGGSQNQNIDLSLAAFDDVRPFELPYSQFTGFEPAILLLCNRKKGFETGFFMQFSREQTQDFSNKGTFRQFAQHGTLAEAYPDTTRTIDDDTGILYTPTRFDPIFSPISRKDLFNKARFAIIGNEMIAFQDIQPEGSDYRLTGCIRGTLNTPRESHANGADIWLVTLGDNILKGVSASNFWLKFVPVFANKSFDPSLVTAVEVNLTNKAKKPRRPARLEAVRSGGTVTLTIFPNTPDIDGFGEGFPENVIAAAPPYPFNGDFLVDDGTTGDEVWTVSQKTISKSGSFTFTAKHRRFGMISDVISVNVGATNGTYIGE